MEIARRWWDRLQRVPSLVSDSVLAAVLTVAAIVEFRLYHPGLSAAPGLDMHMAGVLLFTLPLAVRRRHPLVCTGLQIAGSALVLAQPPYTASSPLCLASIRSVSTDRPRGSPSDGSSSA